MTGMRLAGGGIAGIDPTRVCISSSALRRSGALGTADGKTFKRPRRPFEKERLDSELKLVGEYGLRNKRELLRVQFALSKIRKAARVLLTLDEKDTKRIFEGDALLRRMMRYGLLVRTPTAPHLPLDPAQLRRAHAAGLCTVASSLDGALSRRTTCAPARCRSLRGCRKRH